MAAAQLIVLRAGAGYGKTTLARQWMEGDPRPGTWLTLDGGDDDPVVLARDLVAALDVVGPHPALTDVIAAAHPDIDRALLGALPEALAEAAPFVLVLDDVHLVAADRSVALLATMLDAVPPAATVVLAGRHLPSLRLPKRRLDGVRVVEVGQPELTFTAAESAEVFDRLVPGLPPAAMAALDEQVDGWPAVAHLAALALNGHASPSAAVEALEHVHLVAEYFRDELLAGLPEATRDFLVRTSILGRLSGSLCDEVLGTVGSAALLVALAESGNPFIVALDDEPDAWRYHHLFADLLVAELRRRSPGEERELRRRAASWCSAHGDAEGAVGQALAVGDVDLLASVVEAQLWAVLASGRVASLERWLAMVPPDEARERPPLAIAAGMVAVAAGRQAEAQRWLEAARAVGPDPLDGDGAPTAVAWAGLEMLVSPGGVKRLARIASVVEAVGPDGNPWYGLARMLGAVSRHLMGEEPDPVAAYEGAEFSCRGLGAVHAVALAHLALACFDAGDGPRGAATADEAVAELEAMGLERYSLAQLVRCVQVLAAARRGRHDVSVRVAAEVEEVLGEMGDLQPRAEAQWRLVLADAAMLRGDVGEARRNVDRAEQMLVGEPEAVVLHDHVDDLRSRLDALPGPDAPYGVLGLTAAELRVLHELPTHRSLEEIATELFVSRNTVKSHTLAIYRKLGVARRGDAVAAARSLGLLEPASDGRK